MILSRLPFPPLPSILFAVGSAREALTLVVQAGQTNEESGVSDRLELYQKGLPFREP